MPAMTLNLPDADWAGLEAVAADAGDTKTAVIRKALQVYASVRSVRKDGRQIFLESSDGKRTELVIL